MTTPPNVLHVQPAVLKEYATAVLYKIGMPAEDAELVANSLVEANIRGVDSHGIVRLIYYVNKMRQGGTKVRPDIRLERDHAATAVVDGNHGMGQVVGTYAMNVAVEKASKYGIGMVAVKNSEHFGTAASYAMMALERDMIGIACTNAPPVMAPWGGKQQAIGNNPMAFAIPTATSAPIVLDMAMSKVAGGKVRLAAKRGEKIPNNWIVNKHGEPTEDPNNLPEGALLPEGHKGYGLAVIVEVLSGVLPGAAILSSLPNWLFNPEKPTRTGHTMIAINIDNFMPVDDFKQRVESMIKELHDHPPAAGVDRVLLPGEIEHLVAQQRRNGFDIPIEVYHDLRNVGLELGIATEILDASTEKTQ
jgi:LDH2 family malate/lactate/ureidoglycolate dehydrogenase